MPVTEAEIRAKYPQARVEAGVLFFFRPEYDAYCYSEGIAACRYKISLNELSSMRDVDGLFLTPAAAKKAVTDCLPEAEARFKRIVERMNALENSEAFRVHEQSDEYGGISISFKINNIPFTFTWDR